MPLYKYTSTAFIEYLQNCTIRFSPPCEFNDPFDGIPQAKAILGGEAYVKMCKQFFHAHRDQLNQDDKLPAEQFLGRFAKNEYRDRLIAKRNSDFRILCLTKADPQSEAAALMWGHYATHTDLNGKTRPHAGIALQFDETHSWFEEHRTRRDRNYGEVEYRAQRAEIKTDDRKSLFVKSTLWAYEKEVRLVRCIKDGANDLTASDKSLAKYPPDMLKAIYIGLRGAPDLENTIAEKLSKNPDLKHVRVLKITNIDPDDFKFQASA